MLARILVVLGLVLLAIPSPAAETWVCPMHCEGRKTYAAPGKCPVCGMALEREGEPAAPPLNTRDYRVDLSVDPKPPIAGKPATLTLVPRLTRDGSTVRDLEPTRGQWMLVTAVARDLR